MRVLGFLLARDSLGIMREKGRERSPVTGERESGRIEIGRREATRGNERGLRYRETEFGVLFITSELTSTTMPSLRTVHCYFSLSLALSLSASNTYAHAAKRILLLFFRKVFT